MKKGMQQESRLMDRISKKDAQALAWLRYVLNPQSKMPTVTDWSALIAFAEKQALTGICLPEERPKNLDQALALQWIGQVQQIEQRNKVLNARIEQLFGMLEDVGFNCCLLKGQGNAAMYSKPLRRCPGDIDVWVDADEEHIYQYVRKKIPDAEESFKHIHFPLFEDAPVDVHTVPLKFYNARNRRRVNQWIDANKRGQFNHTIKLANVEKPISVPTNSFNAIYQLGHMLIHTFDEGLGLRQVVDYYYVLKGLHVSKNEREELVSVIESLGMIRFAGAIMWLEHSVLELPIEKCLLTPNEERGQYLLNDILEGGNFGHHSERYGGRKGFYYRGYVEALRDFRMLSLAPREGIARIFSKVITAVLHPIRILKQKRKQPIKI